MLNSAAKNTITDTNQGTKLPLNVGEGQGVDLNSANQARPDASVAPASTEGVELKTGVKVDEGTCAIQSAVKGGY